jgi:DNA polymerase-1
MIPSGKLIACDTETTGLNPWKGDRPFAFSFCNEKGDAGFFRWEVDPFTRNVLINHKQWAVMKKFFEDSSIAKVFHNAKFDIRMLEKLGIEVRGTVHDTMFAMHCLRTLEPTLALKPIAEKYAGIPNNDEKDLQKATLQARRMAKEKGWKLATDETHGDRPAFADYWLAPPELLAKYAITDVVRTITLWLLFRGLLKTEGVWEVYQEEMKLLWVTYQMEKRGVRVFPDVIRKEVARNKEIMKVSDKAIQKICPGINVDSPKQLVQYFYETIDPKNWSPELVGMKTFHGTNSGKPRHTPSKYTENGNASVDTETLLKLEDPLSRKIIEFKTAEKAAESFFGRYLRLMVKEDDGYIIHPDFRQIGPVTGRFSCREPNLQNVADPYGTRAPIPIPARMSFGPRKGYVWYHMDYKQMELWLFSSPKIADERKMLDVLLSGRDLPSETAIEMWGKERLEQDKREGRGVTRIRAKLMLYGIVYGIGPNGLANLNKIPVQEAKDDLARFKKVYPNIDKYMERTIRKAEQQGYVVGPLGRRFQTDRNVSYKAANYIVQGSAAQVLKKGMIDTHNYLSSSGIDGHLIMTIHDELAFEINKRHETVKNIRALKKIMESYGRLFGIPKLPVDVERVKDNWMEKEEMEI